MLKQNIMLNNPLRLMGYDQEDVLAKGGFGALMARAGVGKTAFLVQMALDKLLRGKNVLHITLNEPVEKVCLWYEEVFRNIAHQENFQQNDLFWDAILPNRFIMTFKADGFDVPTLEERITDLTEQGIFFPQILIVDGLPFAETPPQMLEDLKALAKEMELALWFTVRTHRHETPGPDGIPAPLQNVQHLFDVAIELQPDGKNINVRAVKGEPSGPCEIILDPATMLVRDFAE